MGLKEELEKEVKNIFSSRWTKRKGTVVPNDTGIKLNNDGVELDATVLYADLSKSTNLVDSYDAEFAAEVYKSYLICAAKIIRSECGEIVAYDGDRIMAIFTGDSKNTSAVRTAMKINSSVNKIINPAIIEQYGNNRYTVKQVVGIDTSELFIAKTGIRGANDLVWVGRAANYAAKLANLNNFSTYITSSVYENIHQSARYSNNIDMWDKRSWNGITIYASNYTWKIK